MSKERSRISIKYNIKKEILRRGKLGKSRLTFDSARNNPATRFEPKNSYAC